MVVGYFEGVNKIVIISNENKRYTRSLGVCGLNVCGSNYTYYDKNMVLHILDMKYIKKIKMYKDDVLVKEI